MKYRNTSLIRWSCKYTAGRAERTLVDPKMEYVRRQSESCRAGLSNKPRDSVQLFTPEKPMWRLHHVVSNLVERMVKPEAPSALEFL
jgi:hypothetical protein